MKSRVALIGFAWAALVVSPGHAQPASGNGAFIGGNATPAPGQTCVQVRISGQAASSLNCLNQALSQQVQNAGGSQPAAPLSAISPSSAVGTFNEQGLREQYGQNFGKSAIPYRPPASVYGSTLH